MRHRQLLRLRHSILPTWVLTSALLLLQSSVAAPAAAQERAPQGLQDSGWLAPLSDGTELPLPTGERLDPSVPSPAQVLEYPLGSRFTHHAEILNYLEALDTASGRVTLWSYGVTYEGRPLALLAVSSKANLARLDEIREANLRLADPAMLDGSERRRLLEDQPAIVWLSYGVHGNESSSSEAAMATAYLLAADREMEATLERVVVLIDPLSNPDGRERYVHGYEQRRGAAPDPDPQALEHSEPWPGGRQNHYLFDLNRDWSWATQQETRRRLAEYRRWEPQVHVDLHEMSTRSTYFFPPAAQPVHPLIDPRTLAWLEIFGKGNAAAFDAEGWVYYEGENFDLFYPGYGDSYPALRGAVGMTYEMAGGGRAGTVIRLPDDRELTLADRVARHLTASLATVETAAGHARRLLEDFVDARSAPERQEPTSFVWAADQPEAAALAHLLDLHGIRLHRLSRDAELAVAPVTPPPPAGDESPGDAEGEEDREIRRQGFSAGDWVVSTRQPLGRLVRSLLERAAEMPEGFLERQRHRIEQGLDAEFYDITAWTLPLAFNLRVWRLDGEPAPLRVHVGSIGEGRIEGRGGVGYLIPPRGLTTYRFAAGLQRQGVRYRLLLAPATLDGRSYSPGTLFVPRRSNPEDLETLLEELAVSTGLTVSRVGTSWHEEGVSLGSDHVAPIHAVKVGLVRGNGLNPTSVGSVWHLLDREVELPVTLLDVDRLEDVDLSGFDSLVLPDGTYRWTDEAVAALDRWLKAGGTLVAVDGAVVELAERELIDFERWEPEDEDDTEGPTGRHTKSHTGGRGSGRGASLEDLPLYTPGAIVSTEMRPGHPLLVGVPAPPPVLVRGSTVLLPRGKPQEDLLMVVPESPVITGFAWPEAKDRLAGSLLMGLERRGEGRVVVFAQDPAFRGFWRSTMPLFLNAVMYAPSVVSGRRY
jgi:hypothetical protein